MLNMKVKSLSIVDLSFPLEYYSNRFTFTFMHLADPFIQSDLHCTQVSFFLQFFCIGPCGGHQGET